MKNLLSGLFIILFAILSCRSDEEGLQQIDQVLHFYIDSVGQDMLNSNIAGSYRNPRFNDVYGAVDNSPVSFTLRKDNDTLSYLEYVAGARRIGIDSLGITKIYESRIALAFDKPVTDSTVVTVNDTIVLQYSSTPEWFQISRVFYNGEEVSFRKDGETNIVEIKK